MTTIKGIYQWYKYDQFVDFNSPTPKNLTSLQKEEWNKSHPYIEKEIKNFVGSKISIESAIIEDITNNQIKAIAKYRAYYTRKNMKYPNSYRLNNLEDDQNYLQIDFEILYNDPSISNNLKAYYKNENVEFEGIIIEVNWSNYYLPLDSFGREGQEIEKYQGAYDKPECLITISLSLTSINKTQGRLLHASEIDKNIPYRLPSDPNKGKLAISLLAFITIMIIGGIIGFCVGGVVEIFSLFIFTEKQNPHLGSPIFIISIILSFIYFVILGLPGNEKNSKS